MLILSIIINLKKIHFVLRIGHFIHQIGPGGQLIPRPTARSAYDSLYNIPECPN